MDLRKADTRHKIQLGGLIVKAGMDSESSALLLGLLVSAREAINGPNGAAIREKWQTVGDKFFAHLADMDD